MQISVIIPTYNPNTIRLLRTLDGLKSQTFAAEDWELIIVDNNSTNNFAEEIDLSWKMHSRIIREQRQGLTYGRTAGFNAALGDFMVLVDDDNILDKNYLQVVYDILQTNPRVGAAGGKSLPDFENTPPVWINYFHSNLAVRDLGDQVRFEKWQNFYPEYAPIGAGMAIRKKSLASYLEKLVSGKPVVTDRSGNSLSSGGDNDMVIEILKSGWLVAYFPELVLTHIISAERLKTSYLSRLSKDMNYSWVSLLAAHGMNPWHKISKWSVPLRQCKAWFVYQAWKSEPNYIRWKGACGKFKGLSELSR